ncbi:MAG: hypothetical protein ABIP53_02745, partial [Candidatus Limnocylindrales bacterium]
VPQAVFADLLRTNGMAWTQAARAAVPDAFERLAWALSIQPATDGLSADQHSALEDERARAEEAEAALDDASSRLAQLEARLAQAETRLARSRIPAFARRAGRRVRLRLLGNPLFDAGWYSRAHPDLHGVDGRRHWRTTGFREQRNPNGWFNTASYVAANLDVADSGMNPLDHYYVFGAIEGRLPAPPEDHHR